MLQTASDCIQCFNPLRLKAGQCEVCNAPPAEIEDPADLIPLQFLEWCDSHPANLVRDAKLKKVLIDFPKPADLSDDKYDLFLTEIHPVLAKYTKLIKEGAGQAGMGINPGGGGEMAAREKLRRMRELIFTPISEAVAKAKAGLSPLREEFALLEPHLILKEECARQHETFLLKQSFEVIASAHARERLQAHVDFGYNDVKKMAAQEGDGFNGLRALQRYAFFGAIDDLATAILYLKTGEGFDEYRRVHDALALTETTANPLGINAPLSDARFIESILWSFDWRTYRRIPRNDNKIPARALFNKETLRRTLEALKGRHAVVDAYLGLALAEKGETPPPEIAGAMKKRAETDADFRIGAMLFARPLDTEGLKRAIESDPGLRIVGWTVGLVEIGRKLPFLTKPALEELERRELAGAAYEAVKFVKENRRPIYSDATVADLRKQAVEFNLSIPEWERGAMNSPTKDALLKLLIFHEKDHKILCQAFGLLTAPPELFWIRKEIKLDGELFKAVFQKRKDWNYLPRQFLSYAGEVPAEHSPDVCEIDPKFIDDAFDWMMNNEPSGATYDMEKFLGFLVSRALSHKNAVVLERVFVAWARRMALNPNLYADAALRDLGDVSRARKKIAPDSRPLGEALADTPKELWLAGMQWFLKAEAHDRLEGAEALAMKMLLEEERILPAMQKAMGDQAFFNMLMEIVMERELDDAALFEVFFRFAEPMVQADPNPNRLKLLRARASSRQFIENKKIQDMVAALANQWPDPAVVEAERELRRKEEERAKERAHLDAKLSAVGDLIKKLEEAHAENMKAVQKEMQEKLASASARLTAAITSGDAGKMAEAQAKFATEIQIIQDEATKKMEALTLGLIQAKQLMQKIG